MKPGNPKYRFLYVIWGFLECLGFGGLIYGWGSLVFVLKDEGLYLHLCEDQMGNETALTNIPSNTSGNESSSTDFCDDREAKLTLVFTVGSCMFCVGSFVMGQINFKFGTRITRLVAMFLFIIGSLMIAFTSNDVPWLIFPGLSSIAIGGITYLMVNAQISNLFPAGASAVIGLMCGGFDASSGVQLLMKIGHENGVSRQTSYLILACAHVLTLVSTFLFLPKDFIRKPPAKYVPSEDGADDFGNNVELMNGKVKEGQENGHGKKEVPPLIQSVLSPFNLLHLFWLSVLQLRFYFFLGSLNPLLEKLYETKHEVSHSTNVFMYILICGLFSSPFSGFVYDSQKRFFGGAKSQLYRSLMPSVIPLSVTSFLCIMYSGLMMVENPDVLYAVYVLVLFFRSFLYTMGAGFLSAVFPVEHFGVLYGLLLMCGGVISLFQYGLFNWAEASGYLPVNVLLLVLMFSTFVHPLYIWYRCRKEKRSGTIN